MNLTSIEFSDHAKIKQGSIIDLESYFSRPSKRYEEKISIKPTKEDKPQTEESKKKGLFNLGSLTKKKNSEVDYNDITENKINEELNNLGSEDYEEFSGLIIAGIDYILELALNNFANRQQKTETRAQKNKIKKLKIIGAKILEKHGVKFKIEFLFFAMFLGYGVNRYRNAEIIDETKEMNKKKKGFRKRFFDNPDEHLEVDNKPNKLKVVPKETEEQPKENINKRTFG